MNKVVEVVQKVPSYYVGDDCIQSMFGYKKALSILGEDGFIFYDKRGADSYVNKYIYDERREQFPYSNISNHAERDGADTVFYTNQLLEFEKPYIRIGDGLFSQYYAIKDHDQAWLVNNFSTVDPHISYMTYEELLEFVDKHDNEEVYYIGLSGSWCSSIDRLFPSEKCMYDFIQRKFVEDIRFLEAYQYGYELQNREHLPMLLNYVNKAVDDIDFSLIDFNVRLNNDPLFIIRISDEGIKVQRVEAVFVRENEYSVAVYDIPVTKYTLGQIKDFSQVNIKEPRISLKLNPGVTKRDVQKAKQMIKALKK